MDTRKCTVVACCCGSFGMFGSIYLNLVEISCQSGLWYVLLTPKYVELCIHAGRDIHNLHSVFAFVYLSIYIYMYVYVYAKLYSCCAYAWRFRDVWFNLLQLDWDILERHSWWSSMSVRMRLYTYYIYIAMPWFNLLKLNWDSLCRRGMGLRKTA